MDSANTRGTYQYVGYDGKSFRVIQQGKLTIMIQDSMNVSGEWQFNTQQSEQLTGEFQNGILTLNLNPESVDNNLFLRGTLQGRTYRGVWSQSGIAGVMEQGMFFAEKQ